MELSRLYGKMNTCMEFSFFDLEDVLHCTLVLSALILERCDQPLIYCLTDDNLAHQRQIRYQLPPENLTRCVLPHSVQSGCSVNLSGAGEWVPFCRHN